MTSLTIKAQLAAIGASIKTVGQARAVIGAATSMIHAAFERAEDLTEQAELRATALSYLNQANTYAGRVYSELPSDGPSQSRALTLTEQARAAEVVRESGEALESINDALRETAFDFVAGFKEVLERVGGAAGAVVGIGGQGVLILLWAFLRQSWWVLLLAAVIVIAVRRGALRAARAALGGAS